MINFFYIRFNSFSSTLEPHYNLPNGLKYTTLDERERFYREEFNLGAVESWFPRGLQGIVFAVIIGRHTGIAPEEYLNDAKTTILIDEYFDLDDVRRYLVMFRPESVYYDRNIYEKDGSIRGHEIAFDVDPENLLSDSELRERLKRRQGLSFDMEMFEGVKEKTLELYDWLESLFHDKRIVYSGRGFHIHIMDDDAYSWSRTRRTCLARRLRKEGAPIDPWVTTGGSRLIRLPYSLHGMVSRIVLPLGVSEVKDFNPITDDRCLPKYIKKTGNARIRA